MHVQCVLYVPVSCASVGGWMFARARSQEIASNLNLPILWQKVITINDWTRHLNRHHDNMLLARKIMVCLIIVRKLLFFRAWEFLSPCGGTFDGKKRLPEENKKQHPPKTNMIF